MKWCKIIVVCLLVGAVECAAMAVSEIEEFRNFLKKTSYLDETLKKGPGLEHDDDTNSISEHAWEDSGKFEGDIILNERQRKVIVQEVAEGLSRNGLVDTTKRWPDNEVIYYIQREHFNSDQVQAIEDGINDLAQASCIKFRPYKKGDRDAVVIQGSRRGCFSQVGYHGGYQVLNLSGRHPVGRGCFRHGTVVHELLHTLGFYHMQSSPDRDDYINVLWENIVEPAKHNFRKYNTFSVSDFGVGYDYDSVLHYSRRAFSRNGRDTLVPKQGGASIGQRHGLSDKDTEKLNRMYCNAGGTDNDHATVKHEYEQTTHKSVGQKHKRPTPKAGHFEGHGIGYHQGKTVVIKLTPSEAKTYNLPDFPTFHNSDYFSKAPEALSPTYEENGKELKYSYKSPKTEAASPDKEYERDRNNSEEHHNEDKTTEDENATSEDYDHENHEIDNNDYGKDAPINIEDSYKSTVQAYENDGAFNSSDNLKDDKQTHKDEKPEIKPEGNEKSSDDHHSKDNEDDNTPDDIDFDFNEAFERLGKIIKTHVYPSHEPNFDIYKGIGYHDDDNKKSKYSAYDFEKPFMNHQKNNSTLPSKDSRDFYVLNDKLPREFAHIDEPSAKHDKDLKDKLTNRSAPSKTDRHVQKGDDLFKSSYTYKGEHGSTEDKSDDSSRHGPYSYGTLSDPDENEKNNQLLTGDHSIVGYILPTQFPQDSHDDHDYDIYSPPDFDYASSKIKQDHKSKNYDKAFKIIGLLVPLSDHKKRSTYLKVTEEKTSDSSAQF